MKRSKLFLGVTTAALAIAGIAAAKVSHGNFTKKAYYLTTTHSSVCLQAKSGPYTSTVAASQGFTSGVSGAPLLYTNGVARAGVPACFTPAYYIPQ